jgi:hypothetical protein
MISFYEGYAAQSFFLALHIQWGGCALVASCEKMCKASLIFDSNIWFQIIMLQGISEILLIFESRYLAKFPDICPKTKYLAKYLENKNHSNKANYCTHHKLYPMRSKDDASHYCSGSFST